MIDIRLDHITKLYGRGAAAALAVNDVCLEVAAGELFFLLGPSGCGKTTLLRIIAGLLSADAGSVHLGGRDVTGLAAEKRNTAMVFHNYALWPHMTVRQNVEFGPKMRGAAADDRRSAGAEGLARVEMSDYARRKPNQLSGGQQQRVALARALASGAPCLLLDEPLSNLDARLRLAMRTELRQLVKAAGTTGIYVTHDQKEALSMADRIAVMHAGQIAQVGPAEKLYNRPVSRFVADFLGEANFIDGRVVAPGRPATIQTPAGQLQVEDCDLPAGQEVTCCVRPERIELAAPDAQARADESLLPVRVAGSVYLGEIRQYFCSLGNGLDWKVTVLSDASGPHAPGPAALRIASRDVAVLQG